MADENRLERPNRTADKRMYVPLQHVGKAFVSIVNNCAALHLPDEEPERKCVEIMAVDCVEGCAPRPPEHLQIQRRIEEHLRRAAAVRRAEKHALDFHSLN